VFDPARCVLLSTLNAPMGDDDGGALLALLQLVERRLHLPLALIVQRCSRCAFLFVGIGLFG
jgi:hypothetical protein